MFCSCIITLPIDPGVGKQFDNESEVGWTVPISHTRFERLRFVGVIYLKNYQWCFSQWWKLRVTDQGEFELPSSPWRPNFAERTCTLFILEPSIDHVTKSCSSTVVFPPKFETNQPNHACDLYVYNWVLLYFQSKIKICELASRTCHDLIYIINCEIDRAKKVFKVTQKYSFWTCT